MISADVLQIVVGSIRNDGVDGFRTANPSKIRDTDLALIDRNDHFLGSVNYCAFELCLVEVCNSDRRVRNSACPYECGSDREIFEVFQCEWSRNTATHPV